MFRAWASEQTGFLPVPRIKHTYHAANMSVNFYRLFLMVTGLVAPGPTVGDIGSTSSLR